jgi:cytochrome P450
MYLRAIGAVCVSVSALVANALWLGSPFDDDVPNSNILHEALRLLPPAWALQRHASPLYSASDARIGKDDNVVILPLLMHRDPALWETPDVFSPRRWDTADPETAVGYLPFGHASEFCWARHMVMPLAEYLLTLIRRGGLVVDPRQKNAYVPLRPVLGVRKVVLLPKH